MAPLTSPRHWTPSLPTCSHVPASDPLPSEPATRASSDSLSETSRAGLSSRRSSSSDSTGLGYGAYAAGGPRVCGRSGFPVVQCVCVCVCVCVFMLGWGGLLSLPLPSPLGFLLGPGPPHSAHSLLSVPISMARSGGARATSMKGYPAKITAVGTGPSRAWSLGFSDSCWFMHWSPNQY